MTNRLMLSAIAGSAVAACCCTPASAALLEEGTYHLQNHPDGIAAPPPYGLRLDELVDVDGDHHDVFTFDFDDDRSDMRITVGDDSIRIFGTVYGGLNEGAGYSDDWVGQWNVDFTYNFYEFVPGDDDRWTIGPAAADHYGTISPLFGDETSFWLQDEAGDNPYSFQLGDDEDDNGYRGFDGISGWGWLNHAPVIHDNLPRNGTSGPPETFPHSYSSDWVFAVGDEVPEPGSIALLAIGGLALLRRRR